MTTSEHVKELGESLQQMLDGHLRLLKLELKRDAKQAAMQVGVGVAAVPIALVGWWFLCAALAATLSRVLPPDLALGITAGLNFAIAATGAIFAVQKLRKQRYLGQTTREAQASAALVGRSVREDVDEVKALAHVVKEDVQAARLVGKGARLAKETLRA